MKDWRPNLDSDFLGQDSGRNNDININDDSPPGDSQTGEQGNEDANMTGAPDSQTKSNDNDIAHQLAGQEFRMEGDTLDDDDFGLLARQLVPGRHTPPFSTVASTRNMRAVSQSPTMMDSRTLTPGLSGIRTMNTMNEFDILTIKLQLMSTQRLRTRIAALSGVEPENVDCCLNVCHAFTGQYAEEDVCSKCNEPRYDYKGRPRKTFQYLPATPRFRAYFNNPDFIRKMLYRFNFVRQPGEMNDFFNSSRYDKLLHTNIVIDGDDTGVPHFPGKHDIALAIMTDGVQIFDQGSTETNTCWPSWPRTLTCRRRNAQMRNLIPLGVIPGPNKPKDFDSFLVPLVNEFIELAKGIEVYNTMNGETITLRVHPTIISGDMQAIKYLMNFKGPNAQVPCRECLIVGCYHQGRKTYYIPLAEPLRADSTSVQSRIMETARVGLADDLRKKYGICGPSILDRIPSLSRPASYPHEFMHLFLLNHGPALFSLWTNTHSGISDSGREQYLISHSDLVLIGTETVGATNLIPAKFIRPFPNIESSRHLYTSELWSFWLIYIGPVVLRGRLPQKYYSHYLKFVQILKCLLQLENTTRRIKQLKEEVIEYVEEFEEYYYQYDYDRLSVCRLTLHALLHIADDVLRCGPIVGCAKSKVVPYAAIDRHVLQMAQLAATAYRFSAIRRAMLFGKSTAPVKSTAMEKIYKEYPRQSSENPASPASRSPEWTFHAWLDFVPTHANAGENSGFPWRHYIRCAAVVDPLSPYGRRDSSFIRYEFEMDANKNYPNRDIRWSGVWLRAPRFHYCSYSPPKPEIQAGRPKLHILAHVTAKGAEGNAGRASLLSTSSASLYNRRQALGEWYIIDRSSGVCETAFRPAEQVYEDED
ncbi:Transposase family tnp2 [Rhizoctonia solani]|uniref:Transposase family tnp2 n=1 Tax=Rhizoctonia solani TaxID=456999 RepID=A0A8H7IEG0_9AGAM|nr:Transposase family tnp2 [Rhizoctonia solani]